MEGKVTREQLLARSGRLALLVGVGGGAAGVLERFPVESALAATRGGTLTAAMGNDVATMDPHLTSLVVFRNSVRATVFEPLVKINEKLRFTPGLARSWDVSNGGKTVTFHLRPGIRFHDGTPFNAKAVAFNINRIKNPKTGSEYAARLGIIKKVVARDSLTLVCNVDAPLSAVLTSLGDIHIISPASVGSAKNRPVGTGPFKFSKWVANDHIEVARNSNYWQRGLPIVDRIVFKIIPDADARIKNLQAGAIQVSFDIDPKDISPVRSAGFKIAASNPTILHEHLQFNCARKPFDDKRVRQAVAWAFDRPSFVKSFHAGVARPTSTIFYREQASFLPGSDKRYTYDLDKTKALLAAAGFSNQKPLSLEILNPNGYPTLTAAAVLLQGSLGSLGHKVTVTNLEVGAWLDRIITKPDFDATTDWGYTFGPDESGLFSNVILAPDKNIGQYYSPAWKKAVKAAGSERNPKRRTQLYRQVQRYLLEDQPLVVFDDMPATHATSSKVRNLTMGGTGLIEFQRTSVR